MWVVPAVELERCVSLAGVFCVIISEFCYRSEPRQVVLFVINESSKLNFYCSVLALSLVIGLRVETGIEPSFDAQKVA